MVHPHLAQGSEIDMNRNSVVLVTKALRQAAYFCKEPGPTLDGFASVAHRIHDEMVPVWYVHDEKESQTVRDHMSRKLNAKIFGKINAVSMPSVTI